MLNFSQWLGLPRKEIIKAIQHVSPRELPGGNLSRMAISGALASMTDATFDNYTGLLRRGLGALAETESGRAVLAELGIDYQPCPDC